MATTLKKKNEWLIPQSMITGMAIMALVMVIPDVRNAIVKGTSKIGSLVGLN